MTPSREASAQRPPAAHDGALAGFPRYRLRGTTAVHRAHLAANSPWWFSSIGGRFDLPEPRGTCYLATTPLAAVRERLGPVLAARRTVPATALDGVVVSTLRCSVPQGAASVRLADLRVAAAADFGVTRELESMTPYDVPRAWADAFDRAGLDGVRYGPRFSPGPASALAVFGACGVDERRALDPSPTPAAAVAGVPTSVQLPRRRDLTVIAPPGARKRPRR